MFSPTPSTATWIGVHKRLCSEVHDVQMPGHLCAGVLVPSLMNLVVHHKKSPFDVYIGRPGKWGNPFVVGKDGTRSEVIAKYQEWLLNQPYLIAALPELRGKVLGCWCHPLPCHGDVLAELANK
jgi:hypothetical protein